MRERLMKRFLDKTGYNQGARMNNGQLFVANLLFPSRIWLAITCKYYDAWSDCYCLEGIRISGHYFRQMNRKLPTYWHRYTEKTKEGYIVCEVRKEQPEWQYERIVGILDDYFKALDSEDYRTMTETKKVLVEIVQQERGEVRG